MEFEFINDILVELGWDKGISIPVANDANKLLCNLIRETKKNIVYNKNEIISLQEKLTVIAEHKKNARQERNNCESIVNALTNDIETENHLRKISERELGRLIQDIKSYKKRIIEVEKRKNVYENSNYQKSIELEKIKENMQWNQQDLEKYLAECNNQEDLSDYLNQYTREDNSKAAVLNHQIAELIDVQNKARKQLDEAVIETKILQVELDKTAEEYRKEHAARKEVIKMWQTTIDQMIRRDHDILRVSNELNDYKIKLREVEVEVNEKKNLSQDISNENKSMESTVNKADKDIAKFREDLTSSMTDTDKLKRELEFLKSTIERTARECEIGRSAIRHMKEEKDKNQEKIQNMEKRNLELKEKYHKILGESMDTNRAFVLAEDNLKQEEIYIRQVNEEMNRLRERQYKLSLNLASHQTLKRSKESDITTYRANLRNLMSRKGRYESDLLKLDEIIYKTDLNIQTLEHRISNIEGDSTPSELEKELKMQIKYLSDELDSINKVSKQLSDMIKRFQNESGIHRLNIEKLKELLAIEKDKIVTEEISIDNALIQLRKVKKCREETLVYRNMENFQLQKLKAILDLHLNKVTDLDIQKESLNSIINGRRVEINFHKDTLKKDIRLLETELSNIHRQLSEVNQGLEKTMAKYEVLSKISYFENKEGTLATIEAAIEKEECQRYGDELDLKIRKSEKEIRALENTVVLLNTCNETFRHLYTKSSSSSDEMILKNQAENNLKAETKMYSLKRYQLRIILKEIDKASNDLKVLEDEQELILNRCLETEDMLEKKRNDIAKMNEKLDQAESDKNNVYAVIANDLISQRDISVRMSIFMNDLFIKDTAHTLSKKFPDIWENPGKSYFQNYKIEYNQTPKRLDQNNDNTQRSSTNQNNQRNSSRSIPISIINLATTFTNDASSPEATNRTLNNSSVRSNRSSVKLRLKNQGLGPLPPYH